MRFFNSAPLFCLLLLMSMNPGCSKEEPIDLMAVTDTQIEDHFLEMYDQTDLDDFMKKGGRIVDYKGMKVEKLDKERIVPLLHKLSEKYKFEWIVLTDPRLEKDAMEIISEIPPGVAPKEVNEFLTEELDTFPGEILQGWGNKWFSIEFLGPEEADMLRELEAEIPE